MAGYQRFVAYVYEYLKGKKGSNCGFIKVEVRDQRCRMELHLKCPGMPAQADLRIYGFVRNGGLMDGHLLGSCKTGEGVAWCMIETDALNMNGSGISLAKMGGLILVTDGGAFFGTEWDDIPIRPENFREIKKNSTEKPAIGRTARGADSTAKVEKQKEKVADEGKEKIEALQKEVSRKEVQQEEALQKEVSRKEVQQEEALQEEVSRKEVQQGEALQKEGSWKEAQQEEAPQNEVPQEEARQNEVPQEEARHNEAPQEEARQNEVSQEEARQNRASQEEAHQNGVPQEETPRREMQQAVKQEDEPQNEISQEEKVREAELVSQSMQDIEGIPEEETMEGIMRETLMQSRNAEEMNKEPAETEMPYPRSDSMQGSIQRSRPEPMYEPMQKMNPAPAQESIRSTRPDLMPEPVQKSDRDSIQDSTQRPERNPMPDSMQRPGWEPMPVQMQQPRRNPMPDPMQRPERDSLSDPMQQPRRNPMPNPDRNPAQSSAQRPGPAPTRRPTQNPAQQPDNQFLPFGDEGARDCRRIQLKDLASLNRKDLPLRNNRFLQYGYYNFGHLLICQRADGRYILGVPGGYDQQERFMANMFGFPYFKESRDIRLPKGRGGYWYRLINTPDFH